MTIITFLQDPDSPDDVQLPAVLEHIADAYDLDVTYGQEIIINEPTHVWPFITDVIQYIVTNENASYTLLDVTTNGNRLTVTVGYHPAA